MAESVNESIEEEPVDRVASLARGSIGLIPVVGSILSELINNLISNQRLERIAKFLRKLEGRVDQMKISSNQLKDPLGIDLIEDGAFQAIRALSDDRIKLLAKSVADGSASFTKRKAQREALAIYDLATGRGRYQSIRRL